MQWSSSCHALSALTAAVHLHIGQVAVWRPELLHHGSSKGHLLAHIPQQALRYVGAPYVTHTPVHLRQKGQQAGTLGEPGEDSCEAMFVLNVTQLQYSICLLGSC